MFNRLTPVVKNIVIINVILFIAWRFILKGDNQILFYNNMIAWPPTTSGFGIWQPLTSMFMHANFQHILFNMLFGLIMFGPRLETNWGGKRFLIFYLLCGFGAYVLNYSIPAIQGMIEYGADLNGITRGMHQSARILGASGATVGVVTAYALRYPKDKIMLLFPPIPMEVRWFAVLFIGGDIILGLMNQFGSTADGIAHIAHLGGALTAFIVVKYWQNQRDKKNRDFQ